MLKRNPATMSRLPAVAPGAGKAATERRAHDRHVALLRVAVIHAGGKKDLCVVKNISSKGLSAAAYRKFESGERVQIEFKSGELLSGSVVWEQGWEIGIVFPAPIDVEAVLASRWNTEVGRRRNLPRIEVACDARLNTGLRSVGARLRDIFQGGARVEIEDPDLDRGSIVLHLPDLPPLPGVLRWTREAEAGISFNACLSFERLARWIEDRSGEAEEQEPQMGEGRRPRSLYRAVRGGETPPR